MTLNDESGTRTQLPSLFTDCFFATVGRLSSRRVTMMAASSSPPPPPPPSLLTVRFRRIDFSNGPTDPNIQTFLFLAFFFVSFCLPNVSTHYGSYILTDGDVAIGSFYFFLLLFSVGSCVSYRHHLLQS